MANKKDFIEMVKKLLEEVENQPIIKEHEKGMKFWETFSTTKSSGGITEKGQAILDFLTEHKNEDTWFTASEISSNIGIAPKSVSGSMRKLIDENFVEKTKTENGMAYRLTR